MAAGADRQQENPEKRCSLKEKRKQIAEAENRRRAGGTSNTTSSIILLRQFNEYPLLEDDYCPLKWWSSKKKYNVMLPLVDVIDKIFCIPATSVPSEQLFSKAGLLLNEKRNALSHDHVDELLFLNKNA